MTRKPLLIGGIYFLLFTAAFFVFMRWGGDADILQMTWSRGEKIALVRIEGVILDSEGIIETLHQYRDDDDVKAILLRIDSPGGAVVPSQEIYEAVLKIKEKKQVVASMGNVAASGGYYIASAADRIIASAGTLTGSIGVIMEMMNFQGLLEKVGVEGMVIKSGANKDIGSPFRKMTDAERALMQGVLDDVHAQFMDAVAAGRSLDRAAVQALADGRIFTGRQAMAVGLVDDLGGLQDAIKTTAEMVGIVGEPEVIESQDPYTFFEMLEERFLPEWRFSHLPALRMSYLLAF